MSTATLEGLRDYLYSTLSPSNMLWLSSQLAEYARKQEALRPYTLEELNSRIDKAERESAAGLGQDSEEMFNELEEEFAREELEMSEAV